MEDLAHHNPKFSPSPDSDHQGDHPHSLSQEQLVTPECVYSDSLDLGSTESSSQSNSENTIMET